MKTLWQEQGVNTKDPLPLSQSEGAYRALLSQTSSLTESEKLQ